MIAFIMKSSPSRCTLSPELNNRPSRDDLYTIYIRIIENRKKKRIKTDLAIPKEHFNPKAEYGHWVKRKDPKHAKYNRQIEKAIIELQEEIQWIRDQGLPVFESINREPDPNSESTLTVQQHFDSILEATKVEYSYIYYKGSMSKLNRFADFIGTEVPLTDVNPEHIRLFKLHLIEKKLSNVTINNIMKAIHNAFLPALRAGTIEKDPFRANTSLTEYPSQKPRLTDEQINQLEALYLKSDKAKNWTFHARNMYLFSYYNAGIRVADLIQLRRGNITPDGRLEYEMDKTGHRKSIALNAGARRILDIYFNPMANPMDYLFPVLDSNAPYAHYITHREKKDMDFELKKMLFNAITTKTSQINNNLKIVSEAIELGFNITFHTARHSFADKARRSMKKEGSKVTMYDIKNALGHKSVVTTERYINSFDKESLDEAMGSIFDL
ncbi:site-specific integrase [Rhabdobacter roseus]|uniref:Site-specific recombinase XerD n=1 Tax=Rhabdobacter roseus TaxID=1655419 RepID=A0A840TZH7_9BACT|nr:tyrosine-type recombinase/integrase [Rhabdobacter roseus]MBB5285039.1 site-specific recombinase XerD [Rhabdobacter roseus]